MTGTPKHPSIIKTYASSFAPLKDRNLRIYLSGQVISVLGTWMQATAQSWVVWELTHSESSLGIVLMLNTLPLFALAPWAGSIADRFNRRLILLVTQSIAMLLAFALAFLVQTNLVQIWHIYVFAFTLGMVNALDFPAQQTFIGDLSGMGQVRQAVGLNIMVLQVGRMLGPALAGILIKFIGSASAFWLNGASFLIVLASLVMVRSHQVENKKTSGRGQFRETLNFIRTKPRMVDLMLFAIIYTFFGLSVLNILPAVADHVLKGDSQTFGYLFGSSGAGALTSLLVLLPLSQAARHIGRIVAGAAMWMGAALLLLSQSTWLPLSMFAIFCFSLGAPLVMTTGLGVLQLLAPADMRARIVSIFTMLTFGLQPISSLFIGYSAQTITTSAAIMINAIILFAGAVLMFLFRDGLRAWQLPPLVQPVPSLTEAK